MPWLRNPKSILTADSGALELADSGDPVVAEAVLSRLTQQFGAVVRDRLFRNLMGDPERESEYWYLTIRGRECLVMRFTAPEKTPGVCVGWPCSVKSRPASGLWSKTAARRFAWRGGGSGAEGGR